LAVGVSGGPDSIALVFLLDQWIKLKKGKLIALIVDHKIRKESYFESLKTKHFLDSRGIKNKILFVSKNKVRDGKMKEARINRFEKLMIYCKKNKIFHLFLGHHFEDNIETFILRKIAGSNLEGLNCMQFVTLFNNIQIIRPLLSYTKKEILLFNKKFNLTFLHDPSNYNTMYSRVAVRQYLNLRNNIKKKVFTEFRLIRNNHSAYKSMIFQILNLIIINARIKKLVLDGKKFLSLNHELKVKILNISLKFVNSNTFNIRSKKIDNLIRKMTQFQNISLKSHQTTVKRVGKLIIVSKI